MKLFRILMTVVIIGIVAVVGLLLLDSRSASYPTSDPYRNLRP